MVLNTGNMNFLGSKGRTFRARESRRLSVSELLERSLSLSYYNNLFPEIDRSKYEENATYALLRREPLNTSQEIMRYFEFPDDGQLTPGSSMDCLKVKGCEAPNPSIRSSTSSWFGSKVDLEQVGKLTYQISNKRNYLTGNKRIQVIVDGNSITSPGQQFTSVVRFVCTLEYAITSGSLNVEIKRVKNLLSDHALQKNVNMFAKITLMPGNLQKQKLSILNEQSQENVIPSIRFQTNGISDVSNTFLSVKVYVRKGLLKKAKSVHDWTIPLYDIIV